MGSVAARLKELEAEWQCKRSSRNGPVEALVSMIEIPAEIAHLCRGPMMRSPRLRGGDVVQELSRLAVEWKDPRFIEAIKALFEHGIVNKDKQYRFSSKHGPHGHGLKQQINALKQRRDAVTIDKVLALKSDGMSERLACATIAGETGRQAASFEAAIEQVRHLVRCKARKAAAPL